MLSTQSISSTLRYGYAPTGADPGPGKGRGINRPSCRWFRRASCRFSLAFVASYCIFEAANNTPLSSISLLIFTILAFVDGCEVF